MDDGQRIATLEAQQQEGERVHEALFDKLKEQDADLTAIRGDVAAIKQAVAGYKGFLGGAMFVLTAFGGVLGAVAMAFWKKLTGT